MIIWRPYLNFYRLIWRHNYVNHLNFFVCIMYKSRLLMWYHNTQLIVEGPRGPKRALKRALKRVISRKTLRGTLKNRQQTNTQTNIWTHRCIILKTLRYSDLGTRHRPHPTSCSLFNESFLRTDGSIISNLISGRGLEEFQFF